MFCQTFSNAFIKIYERDNILISNFNGNLTSENLEHSFKIWSKHLKESKVDLVFADFTEAYLEPSIDKGRAIDQENELNALQQITVHTPKDLCSRILLKNLIGEYSSKWGINKPIIRFVDEASLSSSTYDA